METIYHVRMDKGKFLVDFFIVLGLLGFTASLFKQYCHKNNLPVSWFISILSGNRGGDGPAVGDGGGDGGGGGGGGE